MNKYNNSNKSKLWVKEYFKKMESSIQTSLIIHKTNNFVLFLSTSLSSPKPQIKLYYAVSCVLFQICLFQIKIILGNKTKYLYKQKSRINPKKKKFVTKG